MLPKFSLSLSLFILISLYPTPPPRHNLFLLLDYCWLIVAIQLHVPSSPPTFVTYNTQRLSSTINVGPFFLFGIVINLLFRIFLLVLFLLEKKKKFN